MRKIALSLNSIVVLFFCCFLAYTFAARQHLDSLARDFVTEKTVDHPKPIVEVADELIRDAEWLSHTLHRFRKPASPAAPPNPSICGIPYMSGWPHAVRREH